MKAYRGSFEKQDTTIREMTFCRIQEIPQDYIASKIKGTGNPRKLPDDMELVFDLEVDDFRVFNWGTRIGTLKKINLPDNYFE